MMDNDVVSNNMRNPIIKKIDKNIRKTGFDSCFITAVISHLNKFIDVDYEEQNIDSRQDLCNLLMSKLFIDKIDLYPTKRFSCQINENSDWPVPLLPSDIFGENKLPDSYRTNCFYQFLKEADILHCRVASVLPSEYHLRVIHKYGTTQILDDLNIMVKLPRCKADLQILEKELLTCELVRVAVCKIFLNVNENDEKTIYVTVDKNSLQPGINVEKLGRICEEQLPSYVLDPPDPEKHKFYSNYLKSNPKFQNPTLLNEIFVGFGIDPKSSYSFYPGYHQRKLKEECSAQALLKKSRSFDAKNLTRSAMDEHKKNNISEAINLVNKALELCPKGDPLKISIYQIRGICYYKDTENHRNIKNAVFNWITAFDLAPNDDTYKQRLSKITFEIANKFYRQKNYKGAVSYAEASLQLFKNSESSALLEYLKKKHPESCKNFDEESLAELHEKKKKLVSKLKKFKSDVDS